MADTKKQSLDNALKQIEKEYGEGSIMKLGSKEAVDVPSISTGSFNLDKALGIGGLPKGRVVEIYGPESSGKTTLTLHVIRECQKAGGTAAFIDAEHALDPEWAKRIGVDIDELLISQPDSGEEALQVTEKLIESSALDIIVVDSVAALVPEAELKGDIGDPHVGLQARMMSSALRRITGKVKKSKTLVIFINQLRMKIGVMFGNPETTPGGMSLKFYSSVRLDIRKSTYIKEAIPIAPDSTKTVEEPIGTETKVKVVKNKLAAPFKVVNFQLLYGNSPTSKTVGINRIGEILEYATSKDIVKTSGSWYSYKDEKIGQGINKVTKYFEENPKVFKEIEEACLKV